MPEPIQIGFWLTRMNAGLAALPNPTCMLGLRLMKLCIWLSVLPPELRKTKLWRVTGQGGKIPMMSISICVMTNRNQNTPGL
jgi:hypothetical protein